MKIELEMRREQKEKRGYKGETGES